MYKIHSSKVSIIGDASCVGFDFLYIVAIFYDVNSLSGSLKYAECAIVALLRGAMNSSCSFTMHEEQLFDLTYVLLKVSCSSYS